MDHLPGIPVRFRNEVGHNQGQAAQRWQAAYAEAAFPLTGVEPARWKRMLVGVTW